MIKTDKQLQHFFTSSPVIAYTSKTLDLYHITFISDNVRSILGYEPNGFISDPLFWTDHIHQEDRSSFCDSLKSLMKNGHNIFEYRFQHSDGTYRWLRDEARIVNNREGDPVGIVGYCIDISERKGMEEALGESVKLYRSIAELIADFFFKLSIEPDGILEMEWMMGKFEEITGYRTEDFDNGIGWDEIIHVDDLYRFEAFFQRIISGKPNECLLRVNTLHNNIRWLQICGKPEWDEQGESINGVTCAGRDITKRIQLQEKLLEATKYIALQQFAGKIGEDVQNFLSAVQDTMYFLNDSGDY